MAVINENLIQENEFYEYAKIFQNYYGTLRKNVDETITTNDIIYSASVANKAAAKVVAKKGTSVVDLEDLKSFL